jgi:hypothetical protein
MNIQDTNFNLDPLSAAEISVPSIALMRRAMIHRSAKNVIDATNKMTIPHSNEVQRKAANWAKTYNPLEWMSVTSTHTGDTHSAVNEITDGRLKLHEAISEERSQQDVNQTEASFGPNPIEAIDERIAEARARVSRVFDEKPYQYLPTDPIASKIDPIAILEANQLNNDNFASAV